MPVRDRSIGSKGLEQGGPNMGNDYSRDLSRKAKGVDTSDIIVQNRKRKEKKTAAERSKRMPAKKQTTAVTKRK
ncbi:hypothetical protein [Chitinophaga japonensis]|uniref:Uncharacterized protein n=1 Tax=Chitinophaga japonensis TaxID=104662 RepID=A0A562ST62_CHIJA|nr:hypothetical protein [Chitinophaga japonensis]TWI83960.1 hypothetical protein LX66_4320 [Chitinophaga japonensis]